MKLLLISSIYPTISNPMLGIYIKRVHELYEYLGYDVELITYKSGHTKLEKLKNMLSFIREIRVEVQRKDVDLINVQYPFLSSIPFLFLNIKTPIVTSVHGSDINYNTYLKKCLGFFTHRLLIKSTVIIVNTLFFKNVLLGKFKLDESKIKLSPSGGFDQSIFHPQKPLHEGAQASSLTSFHWLGFAGRLVEQKGWHVLLSAYEKLLSEKGYRTIGIKFAGSGPDLFKLQEACGKITQRYPHARIDILGSLDSDELSELYREIDLFIFPTKFEESLGLVGIESLACGTPVIASNTGGVKEYMIHEINGYLVAPGDAEDLARKIDQFLKLSTSEKEDMRKSAYESVQHYERTIVAKSLDATLQEIFN